MKDSYRQCPTVGNLFDMALRAAAARFCWDDAQDFAADLRLRVLRHGARIHEICRGGRSCQTCARLWVRDNLRDRLRAEAHCHDIRWSEMLLPDGEAGLTHFPDGGLTPEKHALLEALRDRIARLVDQLSPEQRIILIGRWNGESVQALAAATGRTPNAVKQAIIRAQSHLRAVAEREGLGEAELRDYVGALTVRPRGPAPLHVRR